MSLLLYIINSKISIKRSEYVFLITSKQASKYHLVDLLRNFNPWYYTDYMVKISGIASLYDEDNNLQKGDLRPLASGDLAGQIGFRGRFNLPVYNLLSHPVCKFRRQKNYQLREPYFIGRLGLVPVFFSSLNQMAVMKLWGNRADQFFNPSNAPLPETDIACWEFPTSNRPVEYSTLNFLEQNGSYPEDAGIYLTEIFERYLRLGYWSFPSKGFPTSAHFLFSRDRISSFIRVSKSLFLVEKIGNLQVITVEGKSVETRQIQVKGLNERTVIIFSRVFPH
jgi:hypothetical protein